MGAAARPCQPEGLRPFGDLRVGGVAGLREAREVALDVRDEHRHPRVRELPGDDLQRLGLPRAGGAGDEPVPVDGGQGQPDPNAGEHLAVGIGDPRTTPDASSG